ncbi:MAG: HAMP domain-containing histidine kinase [Betaproteobacteria bacterium]|nr:HAMP domain-containing histidine kinase [Betaproteobacteria bacterium]
MNALFNLSFRYKIPLWGSLLIITATLAVSSTLIVQSYEDLQSDVVSSSASLGRTLVKTLFPAMLQEEVWQAFAIVKAPLHEESGSKLIQPEMILALDRNQQVFVSSHPKAAPMLAELHRLGDDYDRLAELIRARPEVDAPILDFSGPQRIYVAVPIAEEGARLGTLVIVHSKDVFLPRFRSVAWRSAQIGLVVLAVLLPINWYWGQRTAVPLAKLARSTGDVARGALREPPPGTYAFKDELGELFEAFGVMVKALQEKQLLEQEVIRSERLAAIGRLSAGLAHEINNPLGGMLVALDNFKRRGGHDERALKTVAMIERGLSQIRDTVSAMLVEAGVKSRDLAPQDLKDVQMLLSGEAHKRSVAIEVESDIEAPVALPATLVRQVVMNLLLNAVQACEDSGTVRCAVRHADHRLAIETENGGRPIPPEMMTHLFEPFVSGNEAGHGLGLWVTYQIVSQLRGQITVESRDGLTRFSVSLPTGEASWAPTPCASA